jgi:hypothetical protein
MLESVFFAKIEDLIILKGNTYINDLGVHIFIILDGVIRNISAMSKNN